MTASESFLFDLGQTLESTEHVSANLSVPICLEMLILLKWNLADMLNLA